MYSAAPSLDPYSLWRLQSHFTPRVHEENTLNQNPPHGHSQTPGVRLLRVQITHQDLPAEANHYSLPLSAYPADETGPSSVYSEYNTTRQLAALSGTSDVPLLSPMVLRRLQTLRSIRSTGYTQISPIGVGRTMAQIDVDKVDPDDSNCVQENLVHNAQTLVVLEADLAISGVDSASISETGISGVSGHSFGMDRDLDAQIVDADSSDTFDGAANASHDGFMAEEVEYQHDHSLGEDEASTTRPGGVSGLGYSLLTPSVGNVLLADESDMDLAIE